MGTKLFTRGRRPISSRLLIAVTGVCVALSATGAAQAFQIEADNSEIRMSWDNTLKYSAAWRLSSAEDAVADNSIGPQANTNDGDLNFDRGLISNRIDWLSEFNFRYRRDYGFRVSGAAWYDDVYKGSNDNPGELGGALVNSRSAAYDEFTDETGVRRQPDLWVRLYRDAGVAEALRCSYRPPWRVEDDADPAAHAFLSEQWRRNLLLNKWLEYLLEHGHGFGLAERPRLAVTA